jgi:nicotinate phosphoribosyltransferase
VALSEQTRERLSPGVFDLPVEKMRDGYYADAYFNHARATLLHDDRHPRVVMQVFQKNDAYLGGMDEAIAILKLCSYEWESLTVHALYDGDRVRPWESVMTIEGDYTLFAHLETAYLGVLSRRTLITTNVVRVLRAANGKPLIFMPARHDHHRVQTGDGYAAHIAGRVVGSPIGVTTDEQASWWGGRGIGTVPHSLISSYGGNTVLAATKFDEWAPEDINITVLVDFENNSVQTALDVARALGPHLWGVRLDTSETLVDRSLWHELGDFKPTGVNERLVHKVRDALDADGFEQVKIVVSGGFTVEKITQFEEQGVPVDAYGVGSSLIAVRTTSPPTSSSPTGVPRRRSGASTRRTLGWSSSRDSLGRRHASRLHASRGKAVRAGRRGDGADDEAPGGRGEGSGRRPRCLGRRSRAHGRGDLGLTRLHHHLPTALPARDPRRLQDSGNRTGESGADDAQPAAGALPARSRVPATEKEHRRLHESQY